MTVTQFNRDGTPLESHVGLTLADNIDTGFQIMSDIWTTAKVATVWDPKTDSPTSVVYHLAENTYKPEATPFAKVDAPPEIYEKWRNWLAKRRFDLLKGKAEQEAERIERGDVVRVERGRTNRGTEGKVVVIIERPYGMGYRSNMEKKYGIALSDEKIPYAAPNGKVYQNYKDMIWAWARNVERVTPAKAINLDPLWEEALRAADEVIKSKTTSKYA